jgi:beta-lactamase class A
MTGCRIDKVIRVLIVFCMAAHVFAGQEEAVSPEGIQRLENQILRLVQSLDGTFGVAAKHLESGQELLINGTIPFPMASVFKVPVLVEVMAQINEGRFSLEDEISLQTPDQHLGSGMLSDLDVPGIKLSIRNLINMMMMISDNSATDILVTKVGPENVNMRLQFYGIEGITVDRTCQELILEAVGADPEKYRGMGLDEVSQSYRRELRNNPQESVEARAMFSQVLKDQSTPQAMNVLLEKIWKKEILDESGCEHIISVMLKCQTGARRIKGDLPRGVTVAHKTGTIGGTVNDVGILYLPENLGHIALTVFAKDTEDETSDIEDVIAQIARFVFDYFYFTAG